MVIDEKNSEKYIILLDGTKRPILGKEITYTYEQLLNNDLVNPNSIYGFLRSGLAVAIVSVIGLATLIIFTWRRFYLKGNILRDPR